MVFTVVGYGEVGSLVAALINASYKDCVINVMNTQTSKSGRILDLEHAAACRNNSIQHNSKQLLSSSDIIVYTAGFSNVHGESRNSVAERNRLLVNDIFEGLNLKGDSTIIAITNPVEPIAYWLDEATNYKCQVIGTGTALDTYRLIHILSERFNVSKSRIRTLVIGEHGQGMVPVFSHTLIDGKPINEITDVHELNSITSELKNAAFQIRETEKATKYGVAQTCLELIHAIISGTRLYSAVSVQTNTHYNQLLDLNDSVYLSLPGTFIDGKFTIDTSLELNNYELQSLRAAALDLQDTLR